MKDVKTPEEVKQDSIERTLHQFMLTIIKCPATAGITRKVRVIR